MQPVNLEDVGNAKGASGGIAPLTPTPSATLSIRIIVVAAAVAITTAAVLSVGSVAERNARKALTGEIEARLTLEARNIALASSGALLSDFPELTLHPVIKELSARNPDLANAVVVNHEGTIQGHADSRLLGQPYQAPEGLTAHESVRQLKNGARMLANSELLVVSYPVAQPNGPSLGTVYVGMHREYIDQIMAKTRSQQILVMLVVLVLAVACSMVLMTLLLKPIGALKSGIARIGRGDLDTPLRLKDRTELGMLASAVNDMAGRLKAAQAQMREKERLTREFELAREIQGSLLPPEPLEAKSFFINGSQRAAAEVGGDYYDFFPLPGGKVGIAVADVAGKGLAGCLVMSMLSALLRAFKDSHRSPTDLLIRLDERLGERLRRGTFVTMWYGILDPASGNLVYASAGHSPTLIYRKESGKTEIENTEGIPLGALRGGAIRKTLKDKTVRLGKGDLILQYTDGINEAFAPGGEEQFGFDRMQRILDMNAGEGCNAVLQSLRTGLDGWIADGEQLDDETMVALSREVETPETEECDDENQALFDKFVDPVALVEEARERGRRLEISADIAALEQIPKWISSHQQLEGIDDMARELLDTALYEACSNIVEHGYGNDKSQFLELFWVPWVKDTESGTEWDLELDGTFKVKEGFFLILDQGERFTPPADWEETDFGDRQVWRRGRGFGLDIIYRTMTHVSYLTLPNANVTIMVFDPTRFMSKGERKIRYA